jgi:predicted O-methyltransferase YrrM
MIEFEKVKEKTSGYLDASTYEKIYHYAKENDKDGIILEIGPAQGASTICFALAMSENEHIDHIVSIDKFYGSAALKYPDDMDKNINVIKDNLQCFGLNPPIEFIPFDHSKEEWADRIGTLFIDADGALDRDFKRYFNHVVNEGVIIIDDYDNNLNLQARTRFLRMQSLNNVFVFLKHNNIETLEAYSFLGKQYLTYSIVNYLAEQGFIDLIDNVNDTVFCRKNKEAPDFSILNVHEIYELRRAQVDLYLRYRKKIAEQYKKLDSDLSNVMNAFGAESAIVYSCYYYEIKKRMQMAKVYEQHKQKEHILEDDYSIQDINLELLNDVDFDKDICIISEKENVISNYLSGYGFGKTVYIMIKKDNVLQGVVILYGNDIQSKSDPNEEEIARLRTTFGDIECDVEKILLELEGLMK